MKIFSDVVNWTPKTTFLTNGSCEQKAFSLPSSFHVRPALLHKIVLFSHSRSPHQIFMMISYAFCI